MKDVYKDLAQKLDGLPQGYPATESGVELKILQKIYSPEEAEMALKIRPIPETAEVIDSAKGGARGDGCGCAGRGGAPGDGTLLGHVLLVLLLASLGRRRRRRPA